MEEPPTTWEVLRSIQADVRRLIRDQELYVTQEQRAADKEIMELKLGSVAKDQEEDRARIDALEDDKVQLRRLVLSAFLLPFLVGVGLWLVGVKP